MRIYTEGTKKLVYEAEEVADETTIQHLAKTRFNNFGDLGKTRVGDKGITDTSNVNASSR
jgi:hypothetical protein